MKAAPEIKEPWSWRGFFCVGVEERGCEGHRFGPGKAAEMADAMVARQKHCGPQAQGPRDEGVCAMFEGLVLPIAHRALALSLWFMGFIGGVESHSSL